MQIKALKLGVMVAALTAAPALAQAPGPFTAAQATAGHAAFLENCASCHGKALAGGGEAPPLIGSSFMSSWGNRGADALYGVIKASMPMGNANSLPPETYQQILAFIFQANGATPGAAPFTGDSKLKIASFATGNAPAGLLDAPVAVTPASRRRASAQPMGLVVTGTVKNYTPVTDEMLAHPSDNDWLMHRGNYQAWDFSRLKQVTTSNVGSLQLRLVWGMDDGGR
ncbi:MAG TPA: c-type cytochrome, partial [Rhizomicrobium sp.]|nr:c-type cytochrome [Rhizomicrobium sp.]